MPKLLGQQDRRGEVFAVATSATMVHVFPEFGSLLNEVNLPEEASLVLDCEDCY